MEFRELLELLGVTVGVAAVGVVFYLYYTKEKVREVMNKLLPFLPLVFSFLAARSKDTKGVFGTHDAFVVMGRLSQHIRETVNDPTNVNFEDVQDDLFEFLSGEFDRYITAGVRNVPDINDATVRMQVKVTFQAIQRVMSGEA